ncbi:competence protein ComF [Termitidicoccus mucosus]|uniref:Competence protein ComF n=1 Tax=Termitidicoccus mucosus TaxID=1184151 RepID=A0A178IAT2_9BACT|nr:competence protein ComF [Opitutaceae bacterium TSB47]
MRLSNGLRKIFRAVADVVFPRVCVGCGDIVEDFAPDAPGDAGGAGEAASPPPLRHVCAKCAEKIEIVREPCCTTCGYPFHGIFAEEAAHGAMRLCPHCDGLAPAYREGRTVVLMKAAARALVHELKYHKGLHVLDDMAALARRSEGVLRFVRGTVLVPVPLHPRKERERGFNQSRVLADCLARDAGGATRVEELLRREADTVSQTTFDRKTRRANLKNAFALAPGAVITPGQHYMLVDDVFTTGSTLNSCAGVLRRAGCLTLDIVTFGHG